MAKTGPKTQDILDDLHKIFESRLNEIECNGKIHAPSNKIWSTLKRQHSISKAGKALYNDCWRWYNNRQKYQAKDAVSDRNEAFDSELNSSLNELSLSDFDCDNESSDEKLDTPQIKFSITLSHEVWKTIEPVPKSYHRAADKMHNSGKRLYLALNPGTWSSLLVEKIADHPKKIICNWSFKRAKVYVNGAQYISVLAKCVTCGSTLIGCVQNKPKENENVVFKFAVNEFDESKHVNTTKIVKVTGSQARSLATSNKPAVVLHRKLSAQAGEMFETARGRVPTAHAIRNVQYRERQKNVLSSDIFKAIYHLQNSPKYANTIHEVGYSSFYVMYGSPNQFALYNMYLTRNERPEMKCDSTGEVVNKIGN